METNLNVGDTCTVKIYGHSYCLTNDAKVAAVTGDKVTVSFKTGLPLEYSADDVIPRTVSGRTSLSIMKK